MVTPRPEFGIRLLLFAGRAVNSSRCLCSPIFGESDVHYDEEIISEGWSCLTGFG